MSTTKSPSPVEPATDLVLVSHGSPSDPAPQERFVRDLADAVAARSGLNVRGATLAAEGTLAKAVEGLNVPMIFPHFMADGWFVSTNLPKRLGATGLDTWHMLKPLGLLDTLPALALKHLSSAQGHTLVVSAHGSPSDPRPARATDAFAAALSASNMFADVRVGYVDEDPRLEEALTVTGPATMLPFFAAKAGHVLMDVPEAVEASGFTGTCLEPIGTWEEIPDLIAASVIQMRREDAA